MIRLVLPEPPSANRYWRLAGRRLHKSAAARRYRGVVAQVAREAGAVMVAGEVGVRVVWYRGARRGDLDNRLKVLLDALNGVAFVDDKQVVRIEAVRRDDKGRGRVEVFAANSGVSDGETMADV